MSNPNIHLIHIAIHTATHTEILTEVRTMDKEGQALVVAASAACAET